MSVRSLLSALALLVAAPLVLPPVHAIAQEDAADTQVKFSKEELDQILAPVALYPDDLLSNVLIAATYPLEVVQAARWIEEPDHADLKGEALTRALDEEDWDPSVKALAQFPDVLAMMSEQLDWMQKLGDAFIASEADVMDRIQFLRDKAEAAGNLKSNERQTVTTKSLGGDDYIYIEPADPEVIYVPVYDPYDVYGSWWYPDYPPYYWELDNVVYENDFYWGSGVVIAPALWAWSRPRWHDHYIHIDRRKYNRLARHKWKHKSDRWRHEASHRRGVKFKDAKAWRKSWDRKRKRPHVRVRHRDGDKKRVLKPDGDRHFDAQRKPGPQPRIEGKRHRHGAKKHRDAGPPKLRVRKPGDQPRLSKPKPEKRSFSGPKKQNAGPKIKKRSPNIKKHRSKPGRASAGSKKRKATGVKKRSSSGKKASRKKSFSAPMKRRSAGKPSRGGGRKAGARRGGGKGGGHKGGGKKGGGKKGKKGRR